MTTQSKEQLMDEMVGFLREMPNGRLEVGVIKKREDGDYHGPVAEVYIEESWLFIVTDTYEGSAMLNVEALPLLQKALSKLAGQAAALRAQATSRGGDKSANLKQGSQDSGLLKVRATSGGIAQESGVSRNTDGEQQ